MDLDEMVAQCMEDSERYFPNHAHDLPYSLLCLAGEVGELCNIVKKVERGDRELNLLTFQEMLFEAIDIQIYLCNVFAILNPVSVSEAYLAKREINNGRFNPDGAGTSATNGSDA